MILINLITSISDLWGSESFFSVVNLIIAGLSFLAGTLIGYYTNKKAESIARRSGAFDKPIFQALFCGQFLSDRRQVKVFYGYSLDNASVAIARLPIVIKNIGQKTLKNLEIACRYPKAMKRGFLNEQAKMEKGGSFLHKSIKYSFSKLGNFEYSSYLIPELNPEKAVNIEEPLTLMEPDIMNRMNIEFIEDISYHSNIVISISAEDVPSQEYYLSIKTLHSENMEDLAYTFVDYIRGESRRIKNKLTLYKKLSLKLSNTKQMALLIYPSVDTISYGKELHSEPDMNVSMVMNYDLFSFTIIH